MSSNSSAALFSGCTDFCRDAARMRARAPVFARVVDGIDRPHLAGARRRGQGEIGVATGAAQDREFVRHAAVPAIRVRVVERPIAVDEAIGKRALRVSRQQSEFCAALLRRLQRLSEVAGRVAIMVQMNFEFGGRRVAQVRKPAAHVGIPLFDRIEKSVARRRPPLSRNSPEIRCHPSCQWRTRSKADLVCVVKGLKVVANRNENVAAAGAGFRRRSSQA